MMATPALVPTRDGAGVDHELDVAQRADAARRLDADVLVEAVAQQLDVLHRGALAARRPVEVFTKSTPACSQILQASRFILSCR